MILDGMILVGGSSERADFYLHEGLASYSVWDTLSLVPSREPETKSGDRPMSDSSQKPRRYVGYMATFKYPLNGVQVQQVVDAMKGLKQLIADVDPIHEPELVDFQAINEDGIPETVPEFESLPLEEMRINAPQSE